MKSLFKKILIAVGIVLLLLWVLFWVYSSYIHKYDENNCPVFLQSDGMGGCEFVISKPKPDPILTAFSTTWQTLHTDTLTYQFPTYEESPHWSFDFWPPVVTEIPRRIGECPTEKQDELISKNDSSVAYARYSVTVHTDGTEYCTKTTLESHPNSNYPRSRAVTLQGESEHGVYVQVEGPTAPLVTSDVLDAYEPVLVDILRSVRRIE